MQNGGNKPDGESLTVMVDPAARYRVVRAILSSSGGVHMARDPTIFFDSKLINTILTSPVGNRGEQLSMCRLYTQAMVEEKTRVDFNAPASIIERADNVAELLDISRTRLLIDALQDELDELVNDEGFRSHLRDAYYDERIDFQTVKSVLGQEEAMRMQLLRASIDREPPEPQLKAELPGDDEFYDGEVPVWQAEEAADDEDAESTA